MNDKTTQKNIMFIKGAPDYLLGASSKIMTRNGDIKTFD